MPKDQSTWQNKTILRHAHRPINVAVEGSIPRAGYSKKICRIIENLSYGAFVINQTHLCLFTCCTCSFILKCHQLEAPENFKIGLTFDHICTGTFYYVFMFHSTTCLYPFCCGCLHFSCSLIQIIKETLICLAIILSRSDEMK